MRERRERVCEREIELKKFELKNKQELELKKTRN